MANKAGDAQAEAGGPLTAVDHWNAEWGAMPSARFWSPFDPGISDAFRLLSGHIAAGSKVLEIGFAPGKYLAWAALKRQASVSGVDYSAEGFAVARKFFATLGIEADLRNENIFSTTLGPDTFDCVYSNGVIEHFEDPNHIVRKHVELAKPGGAVVIMFPNYGGVLGWAQQRLDPENLSIHNLRIMSPKAAEALFEGANLESLETFYYGRPSVNLLSLEAMMPGVIARAMKRGISALGHLVPPDLSPLRPMVCAIAVKSKTS